MISIITTFIQSLLVVNASFVSKIHLHHYPKSLLMRSNQAAYEFKLPIHFHRHARFIPHYQKVSNEEEEQHQLQEEKVLVGANMNKEQEQKPTTTNPHLHYPTAGGMFDISKGPDHHLIFADKERLQELEEGEEDMDTETKKKEMTSSADKNIEPMTTIISLSLLVLFMSVVVLSLVDKCHV